MKRDIIDINKDILWQFIEGVKEQCRKIRH